MEQLAAADTINNEEAERSPRKIVTFLAGFLGGGILVPLLSGVFNFLMWIYLIEVTRLRGDTWEFFTWSGSIIFAAPVGVFAGTFGAFAGRQIGRRRGAPRRGFIRGTLAAVLLGTAAMIVLFFLSIYPG